ncbi:hypothetical protein [Curtobacterium flaccumfaciens]|uniref:hypothetical protein n=1 Tax=Curtobacterium flaccumfaciens TaxID=2035 RepID=UPI0039920C5B
MANEAARERLNTLQNIVTDLHDNLPTVVNSRFENQIADANLERIADALVLITEELRDLSAEVRDGGGITGGGIEVPFV